MDGEILIENRNIAELKKESAVWKRKINASSVDRCRELSLSHGGRTAISIQGSGRRERRGNYVRREKKLKNRTMVN